MSKLTKKQNRELLAVLYDIERAYRYLQSPEIVGLAMAVKDGRENGGDYTIRNEKCLETSTLTAKHICPINKDIGSNIAGLSMGLNKLKNFLNNNSY
jgi:hypothetical protein